MAKNLKRFFQNFFGKISLNHLKNFIYYLSFLWGVIYYSHLFDQKLMLGDEGVALTNAWRISYGEVPNRDIFEIIPPFSFLPTVFIFKLFGASVLGGRLISFILAFLIIFILNMVLKKVAEDFWLRFLSISLLIPFGISYWPIPSHHWWCDIFCLLSIYFLLSSINNKAETSPKNISPYQEETQRGLNYILSGLFCGLAVWTLQDQGGYLFILFVAFFIYKFVKYKNVKELKPFNSLIQFIFGFIVVTIPFFIWLLPTAGFSKLFQDLVLFPLTSYHNLEGHRFDFLSGWNQVLPVLSKGAFLKAPIYTLALTLIALFFLILPLISLFSLVYSKITKNVNNEKLFLIISLFTSGLLTAFHRWSFTNMVWALPLLLPSLSFVFEGKLRKISQISAVLLSVLAILFSISFYKLSSPDRMVSVCGKAGCVRTFSSNYSVSVKNAVSFLDVNSKDGETLFCAGFNGFINFLTQIKNPTPFNDFVNYNTDKQFEELKESLVNKKVDWVLIPKEKNKTNEKIENFVADRYKKVFENNFCRIYKIK